MGVMTPAELNIYAEGRYEDSVRQAYWVAALTRARRMPSLKSLLPSEQARAVKQVKDMKDNWKNIKQVAENGR